MSDIVGENIYAWKAGLQPAREEVKRERKPIHFGEKCYDERRECSERSPISRITWLGKTEGKDDKYQRIDNY